MIKHLFLLFLFVFTGSCFSQEEAANWYFGYGAGIHFNQALGTVETMTNGVLSTNEGCTSISNGNGELLFYTDGSVVYNKNHNVMANGFGLFGDSSSTQSAIIVPKPQDDNLYYIFTVDNGVDGQNFGLNYSIVDISLNGGLGAVTTKNINLLALCSEKISAVLKDCSDESVWVITFASVNGTSNTFNTFHAFQVTASGVNSSSVSSNFFLNINDQRGYLKLSPDGTKLANANVTDGLFLYDFDVETGLVSNQLSLAINSINDKPYGIEFSPDSRFLYVHSSNDVNVDDGTDPAVHSSTLTQFDLSVPLIQTSEFEVETRQLYRGGLQLGPDGKIYRALSATYNQGLPFLGVINNPNLAGALCDYQHNAISVSPGFSAQGLPPFIQSLFNTQVDIINNGVSNINLALCEGDTYILNAEDIPTATYTWMLDGSPLPETDQDLFIDESGHYQVYIEANNGEQCIIEGQAYVAYFDIPIANTPETFEACDDDNDGHFPFDLSLKDSEVIGSQTNCNVSYFESLENAQNNTNEISAIYTNTENPQQIFARIESNGNSNCFDTTSFYLSVFQTPLTNDIPDFEVCDDNTDNDSFNGKTTVDLSAWNSQILNGLNPLEFEVSYHSSFEDAENKINPLPNSYYNLTPFEEIIYFRLENKNNINCYITSQFNLIVNPIPLAINTTLIQCDEDGNSDSITIFNLSQSKEEITAGIDNISVVYYSSLFDFLSESNPVSPNSYQNSQNPQILYAQVIDNITGCINLAELKLEVSTTAIPDTSLEVCDDDGNEDGFHIFNLNEALNNINSNLPNQLELTLYKTYDHALLEINPLTTSFTNTIAYEQTIYVRAENDNACFGIGEVTLVVHKLPNVIEQETVYYCLNHYPASITLTGGISNAPNSYYYHWSTGEQTSQIQVNETGTYTVTITSVEGCSSNRTVVVEPSGLAEIDEIEIHDASQNNTVTVFVSGEGEYQYALFLGSLVVVPFQDSNTFTNVPPGIYTVYVKDIENDCGLVEQLVSVIGFPKFFTPNQDGTKDYWQVYGITPQFQSNSKIYIFNRYGKFITKVDPLSRGWDGSYNGTPLPADDYWFVVTLEDGRVYKSHFSLIR
ncbi:T9SS type B sorting domain-containing protein [Mangrovimonas aestuarii]|uniref:T9SS type B sorting domain-containing protein n=1 Tax=Mangrovimonas aestuarii TaxID=3018443 RepID=UPI0023786FEB|nr:T9SS type B sorting domain-containing protein [Mangrovimonas aestuarii]